MLVSAEGTRSTGLKHVLEVKPSPPLPAGWLRLSIRPEELSTGNTRTRPHTFCTHEREATLEFQFLITRVLPGTSPLCPQHLRPVTKWALVKGRKDDNRKMPRPRGEGRMNQEASPGLGQEACKSLPDQSAPSEGSSRDPTSPVS